MAGILARGGSSGPVPAPGDPGGTRGAGVILALALAALAGVGSWVILRANRSGPGHGRAVRLLTLERPFPAEGRYPSDPYVGPAACADCHPGESALAVRSGHSRTLRPAGARALARRLDGIQVADPERPGVRWGYRHRDGQLHISRTVQDTVEQYIADYAFGSGYHATTFVSVIDPRGPTILEHRLTYYTGEHAVGLTPGQDAGLGADGLATDGRLISSPYARKCFGCHATELSARAGRAIDEETLIPNVSCERCHGPGRAHVEAARRGAPADELTLPFGPGRYTADGLLTLCGACHRHPSGAHPGQIRPDDPGLARFQPVGILQSRCFRESGGALSCVTCHDPHARASSDRASYVAACLSCHSVGGPGRSSQPPGSPAPPPNPDTDNRPAAGAPCPVEPGGDCVRCHMPRVDAGQHILFADHWIRVRSPAETAASRRPATGR